MGNSINYSINRYEEGLGELLKEGSLRFIVIGPNGSGKTTILHRLRGSPEYIDTVPTISSNDETILYHNHFSNAILNVRDISGKTDTKKIHDQIQEIKPVAIIYVIDGADFDHGIKTANMDLKNLFHENTGVENATLAVLINKSDTFNPEDLASLQSQCQGGQLVDFSLRPKDTLTQLCSAKNNTGITTAVNWMLDRIRERRTTLLSKEELANGILNRK